MSAIPHHSPSPESRQLQFTQSHPNSRQSLTNAHTTLMKAHQYRPTLITAHHPNHTQQVRHSHPNSRQTLTNAHTTLMNTHPYRPAHITAHHPNHANCSADKLTQTLVKRSRTLTQRSCKHTPMSAIPHHSPSSESRQLQCRQSHPNSRQTLTNAHATLGNAHESIHPRFLSSSRPLPAVFCRSRVQSGFGVIRRSG